MKGLLRWLRGRVIEVVSRRVINEETAGSVF